MLGVVYTNIIYLLYMHILTIIISINQPAGKNTLNILHHNSLNKLGLSCAKLIPASDLALAFGHLAYAEAVYTARIYIFS